jgi:hypothetical protein
MAVTINGTNGITFNNSSTQAQSAGLGSSATAQTWQNLTASRALSTTYTNSAGYPIVVRIIGSSVVNGGIQFLINGVDIGFGTYASAGQQAISECIVPNGATYRAQANNFSSWFELR